MPVDGHVHERLERQPGGGDERLEQGGIGQPERAGRVGIGRLHQPELDRRPARGGHPLVARRLGPDCDRCGAAGSQDTSHLGEAPAGVVDEHEAEAAEHAVHRVVGQVDRSRVQHAELGVRHAQLRGSAARDRDHLLRGVRGQQPSVRAEQPGREKTGVAGPCSQLEDRLAGLRVEQLDHALRERPRGVPEQRRAAAPSRRRRVRQAPTPSAEALTPRLPRTAGSHPCRTQRASPLAPPSSGRWSSGRRRSTRALAASS